MNSESKENYEKIISKFGKELQTLQVVEECSELTKEIIKSLRGKDNDFEMFDEAGDVLNAVYSLIYLKGWDLEYLNEHRLRKLKKFADSLES